MQLAIAFHLLHLLALSPCLHAASPPPPPPRLPPPTGPHRVGVRDLPVTDASRMDEFNPSSPRKLMLSLYYPTTEHSTPSPYLPQPVAQAFEQSFNLPPTLTSVRSHAKRNARPHPLAPGARKRLIFTHGGGTSRLAHTALLEDLASHGYVVIAVDHPYDANAVVFPDGQVITRYFPGNFTAELLTRWYNQRLADLAFVDDFTADLSVLYGKPKGSRAPVAIFGHSFGGAAAAGVMIDNPTRFVAGLNLDGAFWDNSINGNVGGKPFFLMGPPDRTPAGDTSWVSFKAAQTGWVREAHVAETKHFAFSDFAVWAEVLRWKDALGDAVVEGLVGTIDGDRITEIQRRYVRDLMDWVLKGGSGQLVDGPNPGAFPEVTFV